MSAAPANTNKDLPSALLFMAPGCRHCPTVMDGLSRLLKEGKIGRVEMVNAGVHQDQASALGIRSLPWTRIGEFELTGAQHYADLAHWVDLAQQSGRESDYFAHLLETGGLEQVLERVQRDPAALKSLLPLLATLETPMAVRIGVGAVLEEIAAESGLTPVLEPLVELLASPEQQIRADACHYLGLSGDRRALEALRPLLRDTTAEVREIAAESIAELESTI